ncbi:MAG: hypothetical protein DRN68_08790 [Thaumarchaeota archaeon]|nr:MAG: hypothetical protein DRN68_08790 [Nitrososphaerota archaeon]
MAAKAMVMKVARAKYIPKFSTSSHFIHFLYSFRFSGSFGSNVTPLTGTSTAFHAKPVTPGTKEDIPYPFSTNHPPCKRFHVPPPY